MKNAKTGIWELPYHTVLLSVYPILFVYSRNTANITFPETLRFLVLSAGFFTFLLLCFQIIVKNWKKAGVLSSLLAVLFYSFGHIANALGYFLHNRDIVLNKSVLGWIWLVLFLLFSFLIIRLSLPEMTTQILNAGSGILLVFSLVTIISIGDVNSDLSEAELENLAQLRGEDEAERSIMTSQSSTMPDIYYIIVDGYERADYLQDFFDYDNSNFINALEARGFYTVSSGHSNYLNTNYSLNTSLNLTYFHEFPKRIFNKAKYNLYTNHVNDFLQEFGYQTVVFDSGTGDTNDQDHDIFISPNTQNAETKTPINRFEQFFLKTTLGLLFFSDSPQGTLPDSSNDMIRSTINQDLSLRRDRIRSALTHLPDYASSDGSYYLFSHIYLPHIPFLYGPNGEEVRYHEKLSLYWFDVEQEDYNEYYGYQIDYLNSALLDTIDRILLNTTKPVVIVLQADHGDEKYLDRDSPTKKGVNVRTAILNAVYFSDQDYDELYPSMTPVNTFRIIFNHWFGTQYPLLIDKIFLHEHPIDTGINEKPDFLDSCEHFDICLPAPPY